MVLPILEYGSVIWTPYTDAASSHIEKIQSKLYKCLGYRYGIPGGYNTVSDVYIHYNINSLQERQVADMIFFFKVVNGLIDAPDIIRSFQCVSVGLSLRRNRLLKTMKTTKSYVFNGPHNRLARLVNSLHSDVDFYSGSLSAFIPDIKSRLLQYP
ncbi:PREDICTED: uncharacterized protein LOC108974167 isoform X3 [Bactrocera latifrons]|uniref:uncharacterized protein LOC108974167 isoform X3 n=1 Tax=Bactrocera latifrons TaxID=174628 RepID=UPI0008DDB950|nr:PREDICTED: uncharacterized protein LOC108974167 isoform X3 [Bactrocera latifrons]